MFVPFRQRATTDMESTKRLLVQCANNLVPLSLILVGVGKGDMRDMNLLDADRQTLSYRGVKARRDIVQFVGECSAQFSVPFKNFFFLSLFLSRYGRNPEVDHKGVKDTGEVWFKRCSDPLKEREKERERKKEDSHERQKVR